jgi:hypothetical protein
MSDVFPVRRSAAIVLLASSLAIASCAPTVSQPSATTVAGTVQTVATAAPTGQAAVATTASVAGTQASSTVQAAVASVAPTAVAVQTQAAPTVSAAQTQSAPTVAAVQTQIAPTAAALSTQAAATLQPVAATAVANSPVQITQVQVSQADTTIAFHNSGTRQVSIGGWILFMGTFPFVLPTNPNLRIDPGQTLTVHLSRGTDTPTDVYVGAAPAPLVNNLQNGAILTLVDLQGQLASVYRIT